MIVGQMIASQMVFYQRNLQPIKQRIFMKYKNKNKKISHAIAVPISAPNQLEDFIGLEGKWQER